MSKFARLGMLVGFSVVACGPDHNGGNVTPGGGATGGSSGAAGATGGAAGSSASSGSAGTAESGGTAGSAGVAGAGAGGSGTGGVAGTGTGGTAGEAGSAGSAGATLSTPTGQVQFGTIYHFPDDTRNYSFASASFARGGSVVTPSVCMPTTYGACAVWDCPVTDPGGGPTPEPTTPPDAGSITIASEMDTFSVELTPDATGAYGLSTPSGYLGGGETVTITASGGGVPAFTHTLTYPLVLLLTEPALAAGEGTVHASRSADLVLRWDRGIKGVALQIQTRSTTSGAPYLVCLAAAEDGTLTIPAAALTAVAAGTELLLLGVLGERATAGDYAVNIAAAGAVMTPDRMQRVSVVIED